MNRDSRAINYLGMVGEFIEFINQRKSYWLAPVIFALLLLGSLAFFLEGSVLAPAIYSIF